MNFKKSHVVNEKEIESPFQLKGKRSKVLAMSQDGALVGTTFENTIYLFNESEFHLGHEKMIIKNTTQKEVICLAFTTYKHDTFVISGTKTRFEIFSVRDFQPLYSNNRFRLGRSLLPSTLKSIC